LMHSNSWQAIALKEFDAGPNLGRLFSIQIKCVPCSNRFGKSRRCVIRPSARFMRPTDVRELLAIVRQSLTGVRVTLSPQPVVLRLSPTRETLAQHHARWPRRISLRDAAQRDRVYMATGALHMFGRTRQHRRGCAQ